MFGGTATQTGQIDKQTGHTGSYSVVGKSE
jgi:hypothetical protein